MPPLTVTCPYCHKPVDTSAGLFDHHVLPFHSYDLAAYYRCHPRTRKPPDPAILDECPGSLLVLHITDRRFQPIPTAKPTP